MASDAQKHVRSRRLCREEFRNQKLPSSDGHACDRDWFWYGLFDMPLAGVHGNCIRGSDTTDALGRLVTLL